MLTAVAEAIRTRLTPASARTQGLRALDLLNTDPRRALLAAEAIYDRFPESAEALETWAEVNWRRGCLAEASRAYHLLTSQAPERAAGWRGLARVARAEGRPGDQAEAARESLDREPDAEEARELQSDDRPRLHHPAQGGVPLHLRDRHLFIELEINGRPVLAACDTGATGLVLAAHDSERFSLPMDGAVHLRVGGAEFTDLRAKVVPFPEGYGFSAIFGPDLFRDSAIEIDADALEFRWSPSQAVSEGGPLWYSGHHWLIPVRMDGEMETFAVDTGSPHTLVDERLLRGEPLRGAQVPYRYVPTLDGPQEVFYAPRTFLEGDRFELFHDCMTLRLLPHLPAHAWRPAGLLGLDVIRRVRLDYPARRALVVSR